LSPYAIANQLFPEDWLDRTSAGDKNCHACGDCEQVLRDALVNTKSFVFGQEE
jgi:hypothetical protein